MLVTVPSILVLLLIGSVFLGGGISAWRKGPYPWRAIDAGFQLSLAVVSLGWATLWIGGLLLQFLKPG
jgi:hypothetical protein